MSAAAAALITLQLASQAAPPPRVVTIDPGFEAAGHVLVDGRSRGRTTLLVVARDGRVRSFLPLSDEPARARGELSLPLAQRTLLDVAEWNQQTYLVSESPQGTRAYTFDDEGVVGAEGALWIARGRFALRRPAPAFSPIVQDVNHDGANDIVVPTLTGVELWQATVEPEKPPGFRKVATVSVDVSSSADYEFEDLSDALESSVTIPGLDTDDVNGDGRPDLIVVHGRERRWHLQRADATFGVEPDARVDLSIFKDTLPQAGLRLGATLATRDRAALQSRDLDGDKIPDYVIGHGRKVWVFLGTTSGPQFEKPSDILITGEDVTTFLVHPIDADARADLLLVKLQIPTLATLLRGLFGEWSVRMRALAYSNIGEGRFEDRPSLQNNLEMRLPSIVGLLKNPEQILQRFDDLQKRFRAGARGDVNGDGAEDVLLVTSDEKALEIWLGRPEDGQTARKAERKLRQLLFDDADAVWDIDRMVGALGNFASRQTALLTGDRPPERSVPLRDPALTLVRGVECADFDGDGRSEVVVSYGARGQGGSGWFDVLVFSGDKR